MDLNTVPLALALPFSQKLPPELWDLVIDALAGDRDSKTRALPEDTDRALRNCALVCRNWLPRAKLHLREEIYIDDVNTLTHLAQRMSSTSNVLSPHVSHLRLGLPWYHRYPPSNVLTLLPILFRLGISSINELTLRMSNHPVPQLPLQETEQGAVFLPYLSIHPRFPSLVLPVFSTVREFWMIDMTFMNFSDFGKFLHCFLRLERLHCIGVQWSTLGVVPGCMTRKNGRTFLQNLRQLHLGGIHTYGINKILAALPEDQLRTFMFKFEDKGERDVQDIVSDPVTGENPQISLAKLTNLDRLTVYGYGAKHFKSLQAVLRSWKPTEASSRHLAVYSRWGTMQSVLSTGEGIGSHGQNVSAPEENCGGEPPLTVELTVDGIPNKYKDQEEGISMNVKKLFQKASEGGRLKVELYFHDDPEDE